MTGKEKGYKVLFHKKVHKSLKKLPPEIVTRFFILAEQLGDKGPIASNWKNFSKLGPEQYHCHLAYHWVACWSHEKGTIIIEVYYVGSRENAPY